MTELDGIWEVERESGLLPPFYGVSKHIQGDRGETRLGPFRFRFDIRDGNLHYRLPLKGLVDVLEPAAGDVVQGQATFLGRDLGRFVMRRGPN